jgi:hypothetical protein
VPVLVGADGGVYALLRARGTGRTLGKKGNGIWGCVERTAMATRVWLGSDGEGWPLRRGRWQVFGTTDSLPSNTIRNITRIADGSPRARWCELGRAPHACGPAPGTAYPWPKQTTGRQHPAGRTRRPLASTRQVWVAHWDGRACWWPPMRTERTTARSATAAIWFSTADKGLARYRDGQWRFFRGTSA